MVVKIIIGIYLLIGLIGTLNSIVWLINKNNSNGSPYYDDTLELIENLLLRFIFWPYNFRSMYRTYIFMKALRNMYEYEKKSNQINNDVTYDNWLDKFDDMDYEEKQRILKDNGFLDMNF